VTRIMIAFAAAVAVACLVSTSPAWAQPVEADWVSAGAGDWDDPGMWTWPAGGDPPEGYPHDGDGGLYDCRLSGGPGAAAAVRHDVAVFDVWVEQELRVLDGATLTITAPLDDPAIPWGPVAPSTNVCGLNVRAGGEVLVAGGSTLALAGLATADDASDPGHLRVEGTLHFQEATGGSTPGATACAITGGGVVELAGGLLTSDADVVHQYDATLRGYGRVAAALRNEFAVAADVAGQWLRFDTADKTSTEDGIIEAKSGGHLAVEGIRFENLGYIDIYESAHLLVDAATIDGKGQGAVVVHGTLELRHGAVIQDCGPIMTADLDSTIDVGVTDLGGGGSPTPNAFALPALNLGGTLNVRNPAPGPGATETVLTLNGPLAHSGTLDIGPSARLVALDTVTQHGGSTVIDGLLVAEGGLVRINDGGLTVNTAAGAAIDLTVSNFIFDYTTPPAGDYSPEFLAVEALVKSGFQDGPGGYWDGPGIHSSAAAGTADQSTALAVFDNAGPGGGKADLEGEPVDATAVLVKYAWYGDINLDGVVDFNDYNIIDNTFLSGATTGQHWQRGDLNYDGVVDFNDYNLIDNTFLAHAGETLGAPAGGPVGGMPAPTPEPATLALLGLGAAAAVVRRRTR